jgi:hypothetical protein
MKVFIGQRNCEGMHPTTKEEPAHLPLPSALIRMAQCWAKHVRILPFPSCVSWPFCELFNVIIWLIYWGVNSGPTHWATPPALFCDGVFWDRVLRTICLGWLQNMIFLISASWVARITDVSLARLIYFSLTSFQSY